MQTIKLFGYLPGYSGDTRYSFQKLFNKRISLSCDTLTTDPDSDFKVLAQCEPPKLYIAFKDMVYQNYENFDLILTYDERLLSLPNAREFIPVGSWIDQDIILNKTNQISYLMSSKIWTSEHRMRFMILRQVEGKTRLGEFDFMMHRNPPRVDSKIPFFTNAKFHIACENQVMNNMFSEKLLDCFKTYTIPIYYGCTNIEKYFDPRGILTFNTIDEFKKIISELTPDDYEKMLPYAQINYELARPYWEKTVYERIEDTIADILEKNNDSSKVYK